MFRLCFWGKTCRQQTFITFPRRRNFSNQKIRWKADGDTFPTRFLVSKTKSWSQSYDSFFNLFFNQNVKNKQKMVVFQHIEKQHVFIIFWKTTCFSTKTLKNSLFFKKSWKTTGFCTKTLKNRLFFNPRFTISATMLSRYEMIT